MSDRKVCDLKYKIQAVKLVNEIDQAKAAAEASFRFRHNDHS